MSGWLPIFTEMAHLESPTGGEAALGDYIGAPSGQARGARAARRLGQPARQRRTRRSGAAPCARRADLRRDRRRRRRSLRRGQRERAAGRPPRRTGGARPRWPRTPAPCGRRARHRPLRGAARSGQRLRPFRAPRSAGRERRRAVRGARGGRCHRDADAGRCRAHGHLAAGGAGAPARPRWTPGGCARGVRRRGWKGERSGSPLDRGGARVCGRPRSFADGIRAGGRSGPWEPRGPTLAVWGRGRRPGNRCTQFRGGFGKDILRRRFRTARDWLRQFGG